MIEWFENAIGYTVTAEDFVSGCHSLQEKKPE
jgi:hypothetical protein